MLGSSTIGMVPPVPPTFVSEEPTWCIYPDSKDAAVLVRAGYASWLPVKYVLSDGGFTRLIHSHGWAFHHLGADCTSETRSHYGLPHSSNTACRSWPA